MKPCCHVCDRIEAWTTNELHILVQGAALAGDLHVAQAARREQRRRADGHSPTPDANDDSGASGEVGR